MTEFEFIDAEEMALLWRLNERRGFDWTGPSTWR
jgi:hypothetical protein